MKWLKFLDLLGTESREKKTTYLSLSDVTQLALEKAAMEPSHVQMALYKFHQIGMINYWHDAGLHARVILDPQWLVDSISLLIRDYGLHGRHVATLSRTQRPPVVRPDAIAGCLGRVNKF